MAQTFKIVKGVDRVQHDIWFQLANEEGRATRSEDCPLNLRQRARLEVCCVVENWSKIPCAMKNVKTVSSFKRSYKNSQRMDHWEFIIK
jgi:hypothetical protein